jgi:hypothetical protein
MDSDKYPTHFTPSPTETKDIFDLCLEIVDKWTADGKLKEALPPKPSTTASVKFSSP